MVSVNLVSDKVDCQHIKRGILCRTGDFVIGRIVAEINILIFVLVVVILIVAAIAGIRYGNPLNIGGFCVAVGIQITQIIYFVTMHMTVNLSDDSAACHR